VFKVHGVISGVLVIIMVGVADILIQQINYLLNKHYDGLMKIWQKQEKQ
jgi:hypothetical protein